MIVCELHERAYESGATCVYCDGMLPVSDEIPEEEFEIWDGTHVTRLKASDRQWLKLFSHPNRFDQSGFYVVFPHFVVLDKPIDPDPNDPSAPTTQKKFVGQLSPKGFARLQGCLSEEQEKLLFPDGWDHLVLSP